jgi:peroxiredoxin
MSTAIAVPTIGTIMPDIAVVSADGTGSTLHAEALGTKAVVYVMRTSTCPVCNGHIANLVRLKAAGELGDATLIVVTPGGAAEAAHVAKRVPTTAGRVVAAKPTEGLAQLGLGSSMLIQHSGSFVLAPDGTVLSSRTVTNPLASFSRSEVIAALSD